MENTTEKQVKTSTEVVIVDLTHYENGNRKVNYNTGNPFTDADTFKYSKNFNDKGKWIRKTFIKIFQLCTLSELIRLTNEKIEYIIKAQERIDSEKKEILRYFKYLQIPNTKGEFMPSDEFKFKYESIKNELGIHEEIDNKVSLIREEYQPEEIQRVLNYWLANAPVSTIKESLSPFFEGVDMRIVNLEELETPKKAKSAKAAKVNKAEA